MSGVIDFNAIAIALAARFSAANTTAPSGETPIRFATEQLPSQIPMTPAVLITPPDSIPFEFRSSARTGTAVFHAKFYLERVRDNARNTTILYKWLTALYGQADGKIQLGLSTYVAWSEITACHLAVLPYAGESYEGIDLEITVHLAEGTSPVA